MGKLGEIDIPLATEIEIRNGVAKLREALTDGPILPNIWYFYSNKNRTKLTLVGDVAFMQAVLLEGDPTVSAYSVMPEYAENMWKGSYGRDLLISVHGKYRYWYLCGRYENLIKSPSKNIKERFEKTRLSADKFNAEFHIRTERDLIGRTTEFWNWLTLCASMTRARGFSLEKECSTIFQYLEIHKSCTFETATRLSNVDHSLMIATIANGLAGGLIQCNLAKQPLNLDTEFYLALKSNVSDKPQNAVDNVPVKIQQTWNIPINRRTAQIPDAWRDLSSWPEPNVELLLDSECFRRNKKAVEMYIAGRDFISIEKATGIREDWTRQLFKKCLRTHHDGRIMGFRGLVKYLRKEGYERRAPLPSSNIHEANYGGYAGAMFQLFRRFPEQLPAIIEAYVLDCRRYRLQFREYRIRWIDLQERVLSFLKEQGIEETDYPFNTRDRGYSTITKIGRSLLYNNPIKFINSRSGKEAERRTQMGKGIPPLIQATGPFQILELDFHKHDTAAIVEIETPRGAIIDAPIPRWWIGFMVDTFNKAVLATSDSFEKQTTESCVLDLIDAAVSPPDPIEMLKEYKDCQDGYWQPNQILPEFAWHGWDILKMDRAWAHSSRGVLSKVIATSGCAVCFGQPRAWWLRSDVERAFRALTSQGAQRLPTTFGSGPTDTRRRSPEQQAVDLRVRRTEICNLAKAIVREMNNTAGEGGFWESAIASLSRTQETPTYFPRPLPAAKQLDRPTLWVTLETKVEADPKRGITPHVRVQRMRYRGPELAKAWGLVGLPVILEVSRHDINHARVTLPRTGEIIGYVRPEKRWAPYRISWQTLLMLQKFGRMKRSHSRPGSATTQFMDSRQKQLMKKGKGRSSNAKNAAADIAKLNADANASENLTHVQVQQQKNKLPVNYEDMNEFDDVEQESSDLEKLLVAGPIINSFSRK